MKEKGMKRITFGAWEVNIWKVNGVFQGEAVLSAPPKGVSVPAFMQEGIPFMVGAKGLEGENVKCIFPPLIPRILAAIKG